MITKENNPKFYEIAKEFGLVVEGEGPLTRIERRKLNTKRR